MQRTFITRVSNSSASVTELDTLTATDLEKLSELCKNLASKLRIKLDEIAASGVPDEIRDNYFDLDSLESALRSWSLFFRRQADLLIVKTDLAVYKQEIQGSTQKLLQAVETLKAINDAIGKLAAAINLFVGVLELISTGGIVGIAGTITAIEDLLS